MPLLTPPPLRVAVLDLYDNEPNQGMRALRELLTAADRAYFGRPLTVEVFETRYRNEVPGLDFDVYLSSGGPGSPFDGVGQAWEAGYFRWLEAVWSHNQRAADAEKKHVLFICHSFQMMIRFFGTAAVTARRSESFGIFPVYPTEAGRQDPLFETLGDPFYAADFRKWQVVQPDAARMAALGARVLCREKPRPHVPLERAVMGMRISPELVGLQFHPEADPPGMALHFRKAERRQEIVRKYGVEKYERIMHRMTTPGYLRRTHAAVIPNFLRAAAGRLQGVPAPV